MTVEEIFQKIISDIEKLLNEHNDFKYAASNNHITDVRLDSVRQRITFKRDGKGESTNYENIKKLQKHSHLMSQLVLRQYLMAEETQDQLLRL